MRSLPAGQDGSIGPPVESDAQSVLFLLNQGQRLLGGHIREVVERALAEVADQMILRDLYAVRLGELAKLLHHLGWTLGPPVPAPPSQRGEPMPEEMA